MFYSLSTLFGVLLFVSKKSLELNNFEIIILILLLFIAVFFWKKFKQTSITILFLIFGFIWTAIFSNFLVGNKIDEKHYNHYVLTTGVITSLVERKKYKNSFIFQTQKPFKANLRLSLYNSRLKLKTGQKWQWFVKIKHKNSFMNLGSFDYEKWLFSQKIDATGYIHQKQPTQYLGESNGKFINKIREKIQQLLPNNLQHYGIFNAILIGDKSKIESKTKQLLQQTNTTHLSVISGMHLGMIASAVFLLSFFLFSRVYQIINRTPIIIISAFLTIIATFIYMALAGFSTPTIRAFVMIASFMLMLILKKNYHKWQIYFFALFVLLVINPLAVLGAGFWLSFIASGLIIYFINFNDNSTTTIDKIKKIILLQVFISILISPFTLWFFNSFAPFSVIANLVAIPIFSILIIPFSFLALIFIFLNLDLFANYIFNALDFVLDYLLQFLQILPTTTNGYIIDNVWILLILVVALIFLTSTPKLHLKPLGLILLLTLFFTPSAKNNHLHILDVGQGSAAVFTTEKQTIIIDTGNKFISGFNLGDAVMIPFMHHKGIKKVDKIIISHNNKDHSGGLSAILKQYPTQNIITESNCYLQKPWKIGEWKFEVFSTDNKFSGNDNSCVIKISNAKKSILFAGDIEKKAEEYLVKKYGNLLKSDILIAPHHGSKTSSSLQFLRSVSPNIVIISAGFENHFKHPSPQIIKRYQDLNIKIFSTICSGQISINLDNFNIKEYRKENAKFYHRLCGL